MAPDSIHREHFFKLVLLSSQEAIVKKRHVDKEKIERADREARIVLEAERKAREEKTARLREQRLGKRYAEHENRRDG
ncbi:MAG: hypothetical protein J0I79_34675 [Mesorhizobium sp.]|uniref:hypothetical protein n=1 Tax=Mesorhizobium sp. TaxID=1871066 RepID=UPI001AC507C4|nr:hypothetical protein [Mesorhizobium sp.]MBN9223100.1 hypothetical protein [Mesorhizobium sp.]